MQAVPFILGGVSAFAGYKQARSQKKAIRSQQRAEKLRANRSRRQAFREAQIARARAMVAGAGAGSMFGSGMLGGVGSLSSQLGANLGFSSQVGEINQQTSAFNESAARWQGIGAMASSGAELADAFNTYRASRNAGTVNNGLSGP